MEWFKFGGAVVWNTESPLTEDGGLLAVAVRFGRAVKLPGNEGTCNPPLTHSRTAS